MSNVSSTRKKKVSVNPAKNAQNQKVLIEETKTTDKVEQKTSKTHSTDKKDTVNDLDKNRLKNWKLRRELKKALNSDLSPKKSTANEAAVEELPKKQKGKNLKKHSSQKDEEKVAQENIVEDDNTDDAKETMNETGSVQESVRENDADTLENDPDQEYAPDRMELLKFKAHKGLRRLAYKLLMINFIKNVLIPKIRSILAFWWGQLKDQGVGRIAFAALSLVIIFAFIVPPMWGAIESYRSGIWRMFG